jgi:hypothetical protein
MVTDYSRIFRCFQTIRVYLRTIRLSKHDGMKKIDFSQTKKPQLSTQNFFTEGSIDLSLWILNSSFDISHCFWGALSTMVWFSFKSTWYIAAGILNLIIFIWNTQRWNCLHYDIEKIKLKMLRNGLSALSEQSWCFLHRTIRDFLQRTYCTCILILFYRVNLAKQSETAGKLWST